jgi:plasmid maintenance system killer protein
MEVNFENDELQHLHTGRFTQDNRSYQSDFIRNYIIVTRLFVAVPTFESLQKFQFLKLKKIPKKSNSYSVKINDDFLLHFRLAKKDAISISSIVPTKS